MLSHEEKIQIRPVEELIDNIFLQYSTEEIVDDSLTYLGLFLRSFFQEMVRIEWERVAKEVETVDRNPMIHDKNSKKESDWERFFKQSVELFTPSHQTLSHKKSTGYHSAGALAQLLIEQAIDELKMISHYGLDLFPEKEKTALFLQGRIRGYCSAIFGLLLKLRPFENEQEVTEAISELIRIRTEAEEKISTYLGGSFYEN